MDQPRLLDTATPELTVLFGATPAGAPRYRVVWSESRLEWRYGNLERKYGSGRNRWMLEKWCPPEDYGSREDWEAATDPETGVSILGPFPTGGDYEHCFTFEADGEGFVPPLDLVILVSRAIEAGKLRHTQAERQAAIRERQEAMERARRQKFQDVWDDSRPARHAKIPEHIERLDSHQAVTAEEVKQAMPELPRKGLKQISSKED